MRPENQAKAAFGILAAAFLLFTVFWGTVAYVVFHFVAKFW
jgi:hypothetical protein